MGTKHLWLGLLLTLVSIHGNESRMRCDLPADVIFLLDASASIKQPEWEQEKDFVGVLIDSLAVEKHAINVGLVVYSTEIGQLIDLQPFKTRAQLKAKIAALIQTKQGTNTAEAIARMRRMMQNQARDNAKKIAVVITDGKSENTTATIQEAVYARQLDGIAMIALGVDNENKTKTFINELQEIAKNDYNPNQKRFFIVSDFKQLQGVVTELKSLICQVVPDVTTTTTTTTTIAPSTPPMTTPYIEPISCPRPADVVFLLDGSLSIKPLDWARGRLFVTALINSLEVDQEAIHAGIIVYSSGIGDTVPLKPFQNKDSIKAQASKLKQPTLGKTNTSLGIRRLRSMFREQGRPDAPHIGIVITDGESSNVQDTIDEATYAKADGIVMMAIGVGKYTVEVELNAMASSPAVKFNVKDFSALFNIAEALRDSICIAMETSTTAMPTTTTRSTTPTIPSLCEECLMKDGVGYNAYPPDCSQYVACYPLGNGGYRPVTKHCPFGLFWSSQAVACVDAKYVNCPNDPCRGQPEGWTHRHKTWECGQYWVCREGRSVPKCCPPGERYSSMSGCAPDSTCRHSCTLQFTVDGNGACPYRPNPDDQFSYLKIMPGVGHVTKPCTPGTVYNHEQCACVFHTPKLGCVPSLHYPFDGTFDDKSSYKHAAEVQRVLLTHQGTAYFNGTGHVRVDSLPRDEFQDKFVLNISYRVRPEKSTNVHWNDHYKWGLQDWFNTQQDQFMNFTFSDGRLPSTDPGPNLPSGQKSSVLEQAVILSNGTVIHGTNVNTDSSWPTGDISGRLITSYHLGPMAAIEETGVSGGVVYVPNHKGQVLVLTPKSSSGSATWKIVSKKGDVMRSGRGTVPPEDVVQSFHFQLQPDPTLRWFYLTPTGIPLQSGTGPIPKAIYNLYLGYRQGKLVKVSQLDRKVVDWSVSKTDGTEATKGKGSIPEQLVRELKLDLHLKPDSGGLKRWAVLSSSGDVLDSGTGDVPNGVINKFSSHRSGLIVIDTDTHWHIKRTDGTPLLSGAGTLPTGVKKFIQGSIVLPSLVKESSWSVVLPNGTSVSGKGPVPDHIRRIFEASSSSRRVSSTSSTQSETRWYVADPSGQILESGYGQIPMDISRRHRGRADTKVVQQTGGQGSSPSRWELRGTDGAVRASGEGQPPPSVFSITTRVVKSGSLSPLNRFKVTTTNQMRTPGGGNILLGQRGRNMNMRVNQPVAGNTRVRLPGSMNPGNRQMATSNVSGRQGGSVNMAGSQTMSGNQAGGQTGSSNNNMAGRHTVSGNMGGRQGGSINTRSMSNGNMGGRQTGSSVNGGRQTASVSQGGRRISSGQSQQARGQPQSGGTEAQGSRVQTTRRWSVTLPNGSQRSGREEMPADFKALLDKQQAAGKSDVRSTRRWTITMADGSTKSGTGDIPAHLQALLDAQKQQPAGVKPQVRRRWSITMPNGTVTSGSGNIPANLQALLNAQKASGGLRTSKKWSVTLPDGSKRFGFGEMPADLKAKLGRRRQGVQRRWSVKMPDGSIKSGVGAIPADLAAIMRASNAHSRGRRAARQPYQDIVGNCGGGQAPSYLLSTSPQHVRLVLRTDSRRNGVALTLPISPGMNNVQFEYDGKTLHGVSNGVHKSLRMSGNIVPLEGPVTIGKCRPTSPHFRGEIDEISISPCIP